MRRASASLRRWTYRAYRALAGSALTRGGLWRSTEAGLDLRVDPGVFHPRFFASSRLLARHLASLDLSGRRVLDVGCGTGLQGLVCARRGAEAVVLADVDPVATACAAANAASAGLAARVTVRLSDVFDGVRDAGPFDLVVSNPPFYPSEPEGAIGRAFEAGAGGAFFVRLARGLREILTPAGEACLVISSDVPRSVVEAPLAQHGFVLRPLVERRGVFETLTICAVLPAASLPEPACG